MRLCIITCYNQPDYVRAVTLRAAARGIEGVEVVVVKNRRTGLLGYGKVLLKVLRARLHDKPDAYLLTFRGYEMLLPVRLLTLGRPLMYDEFINPIEWAVYEHRKLSPRNPLTWLLKALYLLLLKSVSLILTDTKSHADLSADMMSISRDKFLDIPVGTDETTFRPTEPEDSEAEYFTLLYYGNMLPLHGVSQVFDAAVKLKGEKVRFVVVGGKAKVAHAAAEAVAKGANVDYKAWVEFDRLPKLMREADLCLAGPFGGTFQAEYVVTGKTFQYMAMGRPTVIGMNRESDAFTDRKDALIVRQGNADALADTIRWATMHRDELHAIGLAGQALYKKNYSTPQLTKRLKTALELVVTPQARPGADQ